MQRAVPDWARRFRAIRIKAGKQADVAARLGIAQPKVSDYERGLYRPSPELWVRLGRIAAKKSSADARWCYQQTGIHDADLGEMNQKTAELLDALNSASLRAASEVWKNDPNKRIFRPVFNDFGLTEMNVACFDGTRTDLRSLLNQVVLVEFSASEGWCMGRLRVHPWQDGRGWDALLGPLSDRTNTPIGLGSWPQPDIDPSIDLGQGLGSYELTAEGRVLQLEACEHIPLKPGVKILGRVTSWFAGESKPEGLAVNMASQLLRIRESELRQLIKSGEIRATAGGGTLLVNEDDVMTFAVRTEMEQKGKLKPKRGRQK